MRDLATCPFYAVLSGGDNEATLRESTSVSYPGGPAYTTGPLLCYPPIMT